MGGVLIDLSLLMIWTDIVKTVIFVNFFQSYGSIWYDWKTLTIYFVRFTCPLWVDNQLSPTSKVVERLLWAHMLILATPHTYTIKIVHLTRVVDEMHYDWKKLTNMTVFTRSVQIMIRLKSIRTPPTGILGAHRVVPNRFYTHCKKICSLARPHKFTQVQPI